MTTLKISEDSLVKISWGAIVLLSSMIVGFASWMTTMQMTAWANTTAISDVQKENVNLKDTIIRIDKSLTSIETLIKMRAKREDN